MSVSAIAPPQTIECMKEKMKNIHRYGRPNWKTKCVIDLNLQKIYMNRSDQQKKRMGEKRRGIGFETVAGMGGGYRRNTLLKCCRRISNSDHRQTL